MWSRFSYCSRETRAITKAFKNTKIKVTYSTKDTLQKLRMGNYHLPEKSKHVKSGTYQITCPTCNMKHTGQTGRWFSTRFREHLRNFKNGYGKSRFAQHLLQKRHAIGPMDDIMDTLFFTNKGRLMDAVQFLHIPRNQAKQLNDKLTVKHNIIFKTIVGEEPPTEGFETCSMPQQIPSQFDPSAT